MCRYFDELEKVIGFEEGIKNQGFLRKEIFKRDKQIKQSFFIWKFQGKLRNFKINCLCFEKVFGVINDNYKIFNVDRYWCENIVLL